MQGSSRINVALTNLSIQHKNMEYIAPRFMKDINVTKDSDKYYIYNPDFRLPETIRANKALANMATWEVSTSSYVVTEHALKDVITETDRANTDAPLDLDRDTVEYLTDKIMLRQEYESAKLLFTTTTFSQNATLTSVTSWKMHTTTSAPIQNVLSATGYIISYSGKKPNAVVMGWNVMEALKENSNVYDRIKYVERSIITEDLLAALFDVQNVYVGTAIIDSSDEGETASKGYIWGSDCLVAYFDPSPGLKKVTAAANFRVASKGNPYRVKKWFEDAIEGDYVEVQTKFKPYAIATLCGYLIKSVAL